MEQATVNVATGALGPVLQKLTALLVQEQYRSHLGAGTRSDIEFIKSKLTSLHSLLRIWEREDLGAECKKWMVDARELSYDMDDDIDDFMLGLELSNDRSGHGHRRSSSKSLFHRFKIRVEDISRRCRWWRIRSKWTQDPSSWLPPQGLSELVGMDKPKEQLLKLLQDHEMVCILGFAGMGKTTLADLVYHEIGHEFQCQAFISLSKSPNMLEVLGAVLRQVTNGVQSSGSRSTDGATQESLSNGISNFLSDKRYLVIVDDIWHWQEWEFIRRALPKGVPRCRILATTRASSIAEKLNNGGACIFRYGGINDQDAVTQSRAVLNKKVLSIPHMKEPFIRFLADHNVFLKEVLPNKIAEMCYGMPLAVECLSWAVAKSIESEEIYDIMVHYSMEKDARLERLLWDMLLDGFLISSNNHPSLKPLVDSLRLGYDDLPIHLKTCLLYFSMYPAGYLKIERHGLVRKWMAEGFVCHQAGEKEEEAAAAEGCLDELVSRGLLQPESASEESMQCYSVHPMMRAFLEYKSEQTNFAVCYGYYEDDCRPGLLRLDAAQVCRLSVGFLKGPDDIVSEMEGRILRARSFVVFSYPWPHAGDRLVRWEPLENVRVLSIESTGYPLSDIDLADICSRLLRLRYLGLRSAPISALPPQIGRLRSLETLDVSNTHISEVPKQIQELWRLVTLELSNTRVSELPSEIGKLQHLETLDANNTSITELPTQIGKLQQLKTLNVSHTRVTKLPREIGKLHHLKTLNVSHTRVRELPREIGELQCLKTLNISNTSVRELPWLLSWSACTVFTGGGNEALKFSAIMKSWTKGTMPSSLEKPREVDLSIVLYDHFCQPLPVPGLKVGSRCIQVPAWIKRYVAGVPSLDIRICKLENSDLYFLREEMPNLQHFTLRLEVLPWKPIVITSAGFLMLKSFCLDCRLPLVTFQLGAMPKLEYLEFKFYTASPSLTSQDPVGIKNLLSLKRVVFQSFPRYKSDALGISAVINKVREEANEHPNKITISINGKDEEVTREKKATATSTVTNNGGAGGSSSSGASMIQTSLPVPYNHSTDDEEGGNIIPVKSYYPFGITKK